MQRDSNYTESIFMQSQLWHKEIVIMKRDTSYKESFISQLSHCESAVTQSLIPLMLLRRLSHYCTERQLSYKVTIIHCHT